MLKSLAQSNQKSVEYNINMQNNFTYSPVYTSNSGSAVRNNISLTFKDVVNNSYSPTYEVKNKAPLPSGSYISNIPLGRQVTFGQDNRTSQPLRITFNSNSASQFVKPVSPIYQSITQTNTPLLFSAHNNNTPPLSSSNPPISYISINNPPIENNPNSFINPPALYNTNNRPVQAPQLESLAIQKSKEVPIVKDQVNTFVVDTNQFKNVKQNEFTGCFQCFSPITYDTKIKKGLCG